MKDLIVALIKKPTFVNLLTVLILLMGLISAFQVKRSAFPNVDFDVLVISMTYKGASPLEMEKLVTNPIEKAIKSLDGIDEIFSDSLEGQMGITIQLDPDSDDKQKVIDNIKNKVDQAIKDIPSEADDPVYIEASTGQDPVIKIGIYPKKEEFNLNSEIELRSHIMALENELLDISGVSSINRNRGWRSKEMQVNLKPSLLNNYEVTSDLVVRALRNRNINRPGGTLLDEESQKSIRTIGEFNTVEEILEVPVRSNEIGQKILVKDLGNVIEGLGEPSYLDRINGKKGLSITVIKTEKGDMIDIVEGILKVVNAYKEKFSDKYEYVLLQDQSKRIKLRLNTIISNALVGFVLVVICLFLFLNFRVAFMAALGIPLAVGITFCLMAYFGITSNLISLLGLIIVLGILVDDAIIIGENIYSYVEAGMAPYDAAVKGTLEVVMPVLATISTTIAAFAPMLFMSGIFGKFIYELPVVVIFALLASFFEAILILPSHVYEVTKNIQKNEKAQKKFDSHWFISLRDKFYIPILRWCLINNKKTISLFIFLLIFSFFMAATFGKFKLFPGDVATLYVKVDAPVGYSLEKTEKFLSYIEKSIDKLPKESIESYYTTIGEKQSSSNDPLRKTGKHYAYVVIDLEPIEDGMKSSTELIDFLKKDTEWLLSEKESTKRTDGFLKGRLEKIVIEPGQAGPPVGKPVFVQITGNEFVHLEAISNEIKEILSDINGVYDIEDNFSSGKEEIRIQVDDLLASRTGVSVQTVSDSINTAYLGKVATTIKRLEEEVDVRVFMPRDYRSSIDSLDKLYVTNQLQNRIPINQLIDYKIERGYSSISHYNGKRQFVVTAGIKENITTSQIVNAKLRQILEQKNILDKYPLGYRIKYGGEFEDTQESLMSLGTAFLVGFFIILMILSLLFGSLSQSMIILSVIPFSLIGVIFAFVGHNEYFGFMPFLGVIGLCGVVINDSIVLVDKVNHVKSENPNMNITDVIVKGCSSRLRAVLLTTLTTSLGLLPTAYGIGGKDLFVMIMALGFAWGLVFGSIIILILIPVFYQSLENFKKMKFSNLFKKKEKEKVAVT